MRVLIVGGCVSRDAFSQLSLRGHTLTDYLARQSLVSALTSGDTQDLNMESFSSRFQLRNILRDFSGSLFDSIRTHVNSFDVLLWDLFVERRGVYVLSDGNYITANWELSETGQLDVLPIVRHIEFGTDEHFNLWKRGVDELFAVLTDAGAAHKVVLVQPQFSSITSSGDPITGSAIDDPVWLTERYERYTAHIRLKYDIGCVSIPDDKLLGDANHRWGLAPFHFAPETESIIVRSISRQLSVRSLSHKQFTAFREVQSMVFERVQSETSSGFDISGTFDGFPVDLRIIKKDANLPALAVFNGAVDPKRAQGKPVFQRSSWADDLKANLLFCHDSTQTLHPDLPISWGQGRHDSGVSYLHAGALLGFTEALRAAASDPSGVVPATFGSSAGGFQALSAATFSDARALVNNPQLDWLKYEVRSAVKMVIEQVFPGEPQETFRSRFADRVSLSSWWSKLGYIPDFEYLINNASSADVKLQLIPFLEFLTRNSILIPESFTLSAYVDKLSGHNPLGRKELVHRINLWLSTLTS